MGVIGKYWQYFKWFLLFARFRCRQYRLKTNEYVILNVNNGPIRGVRRKTIWNDLFYSFEKIPFAKPPIGDLRFKAPQPVSPWTNVLDCTKEGPMPAQLEILRRKIQGSEDCLYLNVYSKNLNPIKPLPILVWIYGGGFETGGTTKDIYSPDYFMSKEIILVTITYRLGPFGFLSLNDEKLNVPGNAGLKDQLLGLKWVKENCHKFGGDTENITVFGESAGAASTHYLMLNKNSENLFHKAILMSGSTLSPWATVPDHNWAYRLAQIAGYEGDQNNESILNFLKKTKASDIVKAEMKIFEPEERRNRILFPFGPVIEPYLTDDCVIPEDPKIMMRKTWSHNIPILIGGTQFEGLISYPEIKRNKKILDKLNDCEYLVPLELNLERNSDQCRELGLILKKAFFDPKRPKNDLIFEYLDLLSYKYFWHGIGRTIQSRIKYGTAPTYLYRFAFDSIDFNLVRILFCGKKVRGTSHADDLPYIFFNGISKIASHNSKEYQTIQRMIGTITEFAVSGNPNNETLLPAKWEPVENDKPFKCLNIADDVTFIDLPENEKIEVWNSLYAGRKELI